jgi:PAS domain S-box-containing protein
MPNSYLFQLNLDLSNRKSAPHFNADFPTYSWEITGSKFIEQCIPEGFFKLEDCFANLLNGKTEVVNEDCKIRNQLNHQQFIPVQLIASLQRNELGEADYFQCSLTVLGQLDEETESETITSLFKYNPQSFCYLGLYGEVIRVNKRLCEFLSIPESVLVQHNFRDFIQPKDLAEAEQIFNEAKEGQANQYEFTVFVQNGVEKRVRINIFPRFKQGKVIGVYGIFEDITETVETLHRWKELVEQNPLPVLIFIDRKFVFTNSAAAGFYDVEHASELIGMNVMDFVRQKNKSGLSKEKQEFYPMVKSNLLKV